MDDGEICASDLLAYRELEPGAQDRGDGEPVRSGVRCGRPLVYPVPVADLPDPVRRRAEAGGGTYAGVLFAFDLDELPRGQRYAAAHFRVTLDDPRARAVHLAADGDEFGVVQNPAGAEPASATAARTVTAAASRPGWLRRLAGQAGVPRAWTSGAQSPSFGWHYDFEDVFIAQTAGVKDYYFRANTVALDAVLGDKLDFTSFRNERSPLMSARLAAGDWLYLPARWWHLVKCVQESLSISVGVMSPSELQRARRLPAGWTGREA